MDRMTIVGQDGKSKYILTEDNKILDLTYCTCNLADGAYITYQINGTEKICPICNKPIPE